ncbi:MAG: hypothetical protein LQ340_008060, partial [Diploschistes diacapsis]
PRTAPPPPPRCPAPAHSLCQFGAEAQAHDQPAAAISCASEKAEACRMAPTTVMAHPELDGADAPERVAEADAAEEAAQRVEGHDCALEARGGGGGAGAEGGEGGEEGGSR